MRILPNWRAKWQDLREVMKDIKNSMERVPRHNLHPNDVLMKAKDDLQWPYVRRSRRSSIIETMDTMLYSREEPRRTRSTTEEPDSKKRKYYMIDIEEFKQQAEVRSDKATGTASSGEVANFFDLQNHTLSSRKVKTADKKCKEAYLLWQADISHLKQQFVAWDEATDEGLVVTSDAPRPQLDERGPFAQIDQLRDEHARRQKEGDEAYRKQILQVNTDLEQGHMARIGVRGFQPANRLQTNDGAAQNKKSGKVWQAPQADALAGRQLLQATPQPPSKRQRVDISSARAVTSSKSPIEVPDDSPSQQRQSSSAKSGQSQTLNGVNDSNKMRRSSAGTGGVGEFTSVEDVVRIYRPRDRPNKHKGQTVISPGDVGNTEDPFDPIDDSDDPARKCLGSNKNSNIEVQISAHRKSGSITRINIQHDFGHQANIGKNASGSAKFANSPYFSANGTVDPVNKKSAAGRTFEPMSAAGALKAARSAGRDVGGENIQQLDLDSSTDELAPTSRLSVADREHKKLAHKLLHPRPGHQNEYHDSVDLDDDSNNDAARSVADIEPTTFTKTRKAEIAEKTRTYEIRQIFDHQKVYLRETDEQGWTIAILSSAKDKEKHILQIIKKSGLNGQFFLIKSFNSVDYYEHSCKVMIHRNRISTNSRATQLFIEFSSLQQRSDFVSNLESYSTITSKIPKDKDEEYFEKVFKKQLDTIQTHSQNIGIKRTREEELPDDIQVAMANSAKKFKAKLENTAKRTKIESATGHQNQQQEEVHRPKPRNQAANMQSTPVEVNGVEYQRISSKRSGIPTESFYGRKAADPDIVHGTRSSTRFAGTETSPRLAARQRTPIPEVVGWTKANPNWVKEFNWRKSIDYATSTKNRTTVEKDDIERLDEGEFLNDSLIGFYLGWLEMRLKEERPDIAKRVYFQNSFFYKRLSDLAKGSKDGINYAAVEKWTSKVDIFKYDYIIVPVCEQLHWYVAIICHPSKLIEASDAENKTKESDICSEEHRMSEEDAAQIVDKATPSDSGLTPRTESISLLDELDVKSVGKSPPRAPSVSSVAENQNDSSSPPRITSDILPPTTNSQTKKGKKRVQRGSPSDLRIITLDSFLSGRSPCCIKLKRYLIQELKAKKNIEVPDPGGIGKTAKNIPSQDNSSDCGLFLLNYVEMFLKDPEQFIKDIYEQPVELDNFKKYPSASSMRGNLRDLLFEIQSEQHGGPKPRKTVGDSELPAKPTKKAASSSTSRGSNEPPRRSVSSAQPSVKAERKSKVVEPGQDFHRPSAGPIVEKPDTESDLASNTSSFVQNGSEVTDIQKDPMKTICTTIAGGITSVKNAMFGNKKAGNTFREQTNQNGSDRSVIEIDSSTQDSIQPTIEPSDRPDEIADSQPESSRTRTSSAAKEDLYPRDSSRATIFIPDSPQNIKDVPKPKASTIARGTSKLESSTPPPHQNDIRSYNFAAVRSGKFDGLPDVPGRLGSPPSDPGTPSSDMDAVDLVQPISAKKPLNESGSLSDQVQQHNEEMLMQSGQPKNSHGTHRFHTGFPPPVSGPATAGKVHGSSIESAQSIRGTKRKTTSNEDEKDFHEHHQSNPPGNKSPDLIITGSSKRLKTTTENDYTPARKARNPIIEARGKSREKSETRLEQKSASTMNPHAQDDSSQEHYLFRDSLEQAMLVQARH